MTEYPNPSESDNGGMSIGQSCAAIAILLAFVVPLIFCRGLAFMLSHHMLFHQSPAKDKSKSRQEKNEANSIDVPRDGYPPANLHVSTPSGNVYLHDHGQQDQHHDHQKISSEKDAKITPSSSSAPTRSKPSPLSLLWFTTGPSILIVLSLVFYTKHTFSQQNNLLALVVGASIAFGITLCLDLVVLWVVWLVQKCENEPAGG